MNNFKFNMNDSVKIKLTNKGIDILKEQYNELKKYYPNIGEFQLNLDKEGYYKQQLWSVMQIFGRDIGMGNELPFETEIYFVIN